MVSPEPWQTGHARSTTKKPCCARTLPWPAQVLHVLALVPGRAPEPWQVSQGADTSTVTSVEVP